MVTATDIEVPARSKAITPAKILGDVHSSDVMIGPVYNSSSPVKDKVFVACTIHSVSNSNGVAVRVINPSKQAIRLGHGTTVAQAENVKAKPMSSDQAEANNHEKEEPENVQQLFEETCEREQLSPQFKEGLCQLLCKHANVFAKNDKDLGRTHLTVHDIDTGDARPEWTDKELTECQQADPNLKDIYMAVKIS